MRRRMRYQDPALRVVDGQYKIQYRDSGGRKRTKCFGSADRVTVSEAKRAKNEFVQQLNNDIVKGRRRDRTVRDLVEKWKASEMPTIDRPATRKNYLWTFGKLGDLVNAPLAVLEKPDLQEWIMGLRLAPSSLKIVKANMASLFESARSWGWIEANPMSGRFRMPRARRRDVPVLNPEQVRQLYPVLDLESRVAFLLAVLAGLRRGEITAIEWDDVAPPWIVVSKTVNFAMDVGPPKSEKSYRRIEQGPLLESTLRQWKQEALGAALVFPPHQKGRFRCMQHVLEVGILPHAESFGIRKFSWHALRHTFNTWGHLAGIDATIMRDLMGHSSVAFNQDVYNHARALKPTGSAAKIEALMEPSTGTLDEVVH